MEYLIVAAAVIAGGLWRRMLGGWLSPPRWALFVVHALFSASILLAAADLAAPLWPAGLVIAATAHVSVWSWPGHGESMDMGRMSDSWARDAAAMVGRYCFAVALVSFGLGISGRPDAWPITLAGLAPAAISAAAWQWLPRPTEWAEVGAGAVWWGALALVAVAL